MKFIKQRNNNEMCDILLHKKVFELVDWNKQDNVLVLGAGKGAFENRIKSKVKSITSIDIDSKNWSGDNKFIELDLNQNKWFAEPIKFDKIIAIEIIEHINDTTNFLRNIKRLSKPTTDIIITTPNITSIRSRLNFLITGYPLHFNSGCIKYGHVNPIFTHIFKHQLNKCGFKINMRTYNRLESDYIIVNNNTFRMLIEFVYLCLGKLMRLFILNKQDIDKSIIIYKLGVDKK